MEAFTTFKAPAVPFDQPNVDTDQIIPSRFLRKPRGDGCHPYLFHDAANRPDGKPNPDFILNDPVFATARIMVSMRNFGCGSSREGAVWALFDRGFRAVIAPSFGDIFYSNALKNGMLPVVLDEDTCAPIRAALHAAPGSEIAIDLPSQTVTGPDGRVIGFDIDPSRKQALIDGEDEITATMRYMDRINAFEVAAEHTAPWLASRPG